MGNSRSRAWHTKLLYSDQFCTTYKNKQLITLDFQYGDRTFNSASEEPSNDSAVSELSFLKHLTYDFLFSTVVHLLLDECCLFHTTGQDCLSVKK